MIKLDIAWRRHWDVDLVCCVSEGRGEVVGRVGQGRAREERSAESRWLEHSSILVRPPAALLTSDFNSCFSLSVRSSSLALLSCALIRLFNEEPSLSLWKICSVARRRQDCNHKHRQNPRNWLFNPKITKSGPEMAENTTGVMRDFLAPRDLNLQATFSDLWEGQVEIDVTFRCPDGNVGGHGALLRLFCPFLGQLLTPMDIMMGKKNFFYCQVIFLPTHNYLSWQLSRITKGNGKIPRKMNQHFEISSDSIKTNCYFNFFSNCFARHRSFL